MLTYVEFRSDRFPAYDGEEGQINPEMWGKRLAEFLCDKLLAEGFKTEEPLAEDWGWRVGVVNERFGLWIGCGHWLQPFQLYSFAADLCKVVLGLLHKPALFASAENLGQPHGHFGRYTALPVDEL